MRAILIANGCLIVIILLLMAIAKNDIAVACKLRGEFIWFGEKYECILAEGG